MGEGTYGSPSKAQVPSKRKKMTPKKLATKIKNKNLSST